MTSTPAQKTASEKRILCVGMCVLDMIHICKTYPEEDSDKRCLEGYWQRGGNASNNCTVLRNLGANCEFLGMISESLAFGFLPNDCRQRGIVIDACPSTTQDPPFSSVILVQETNTRTIIHSNSNFPILQYKHFKKINLDNYSCIHFEGRNPTETTNMMKDILDYNKNHETKILISLELEKIKLENLVMVEMVDYVFLGKDLAMFLNFTDCKSAVFGLKDQLKLQLKSKRPNIICTWGAEGSCCLDQNDQYHFVESIGIAEIVDTLGAGDTYCAATLYGLIELQMTLPKSIEFANRVTAFKIGHKGYDALKLFKL